MSSRLNAWESQLGKLDSEFLTGLELRTRCYVELGSTMDECRVLLRQRVSAAALANPSSVCELVLAERQSAGRGRLGRVWESQSGNFLASLGTVWEESLPKLSGYSLAVGVLLAEVLEGLGVEVQLKWPNDILLPDRRKLAGVLIELERVHGTDLNLLVTGIGLNLAYAPNTSTQVAAVALAEIAGAPLITPPEFAELFLPKFAHGWREFVQSGFAPFRDRWLKRCWASNQRVSVTLGQEQVEGILKGIDLFGSLALETATGTRIISAGDVSAI